MRIGLIADIHEDVEGLRMALAQLRDERVQEIVVLGDLFEDGSKVQIHALKHGWFATLDTETWVLTPLRIGVMA